MRSSQTVLMMLHIAIVLKSILWLIVSMSTYIQVQNEQCQEMAQADDQKWIKVTNSGEWDAHTVSICSCLSW